MSIPYSLPRAELDQQLKETRERWMKIGLNCERIDRKKAATAVRELYSAGGLTPPTLILFADSPMEATLMRMSCGPWVSWTRTQSKQSLRPAC